ncbi:MAG TPA: iron-siderophore ABC transporter substrate-binding protein [Acidimicrobiia bacterium]|nr:iron-siderophore ABC transporter substrate-binding protein [Acidimicrobiia bacterium]
MRSRNLLSLLAALSLLLSACGSVEEGATTTAAGSAEPETTTATSGPITITDARGEELTLDAPASEVVGLEWGVIENLISLGVMPVGVADVEGYTAWVSAAQLDEGVVDVGLRGEPSIDALVALEPDLVVATTDLPANIIEQIEGLVPVLVVRAAAAERPVDQMRDNIRLVAQAVGKEAEADALVERVDTAIAEGAQAIADAGLEGQPFTLADAWMDGNNVSIRAFTAGSLMGAVAEEMGLVNAWDLEGDADYGLAITDVEGLTNLGDVQFTYYTNAAEVDAIAELDGNPIWEGLPFVQNGNVHRLPDGIWMFGGPLSVEQFVDATVEALTS